MSKYTEITQQHPETIDCFFAFSVEQLAAGKAGLSDPNAKIYNGGHGLFGTKEGILNFYKAYEERDKRIAAECDPQEVYNYEFGNHECSYTNDDTDAIKIVLGYFGVERTREVKRRFAYYNIEEWGKEE